MSLMMPQWHTCKKMHTNTLNAHRYPEFPISRVPLRRWHQDLHPLSGMRVYVQPICHSHALQTIRSPKPRLQSPASQVLPSNKPHPHACTSTYNCQTQQWTVSNTEAHLMCPARPHCVPTSALIPDPLPLRVLLQVGWRPANHHHQTSDLHDR